jgi:DNA polymerase-1
VTTLFGRKCHIPGIRERNPQRRAFAERQAINAPIQGTAADIMRRAMIRMPDAIHAVEGARMLLQVHDELVFEVPEGREDALIKVVKQAMEHAHEPAIHLSVPIDVEAQAAKNWNDAH